MSQAKKLIVGVDYGTTYSGVSWAWSDDVGVKDIKLITEWSGTGRSSNSTRTKVPSRICYDGSGSWGYGIKSSAQAYSWTKLLLDRQVKLAEFDDDNLRSIDPGLLALPPGKSPEDVVADYLTKLYEHIMKHLEPKVMKSVLDVTDIDFWFSMPALWSDKAQAATRDAAKKAGFGSRNNDQIFMIREPEAAAISCLNEFIAGTTTRIVAEGEGILICDCGGGTVDLASYEVVFTQGKGRLQLHQTCVSEGGKCGSTTIDRAFHTLMESRFGSAFSNVPQKRKGIGSDLMEEFELAKIDFGHDRLTETYRLPLYMSAPDSQHYLKTEDEDGSRQGEVLLSDDDMRQLFQPVVDKIKGLLERQIQDTKEKSTTEIKTILLAGGLGSSRHLYNELKAWCPPGIGIVNPPGAWEAICKGATLRGLEGPLVPKRKCPRNYGTDVSRRFRDGVDSEADAWTDPFDKVKMAEGYILWLYEKGEDIYHDTTKTTTIHMIAMSLTDSFTLDFYECNMALAPERSSHASVEKGKGQLVVDLSDVDIDVFPTKELSQTWFKPNLKVHNISFDIRTSVIDEAMGIMSFTAIVQGRPRGSVQMKFADENNGNYAFF